MNIDSGLDRWKRARSPPVLYKNKIQRDYVSQRLVYIKDN